MTYIFDFYHKDTDSTEMDITQEEVTFKSLLCTSANSNDVIQLSFTYFFLRLCVDFCC